MKFFHLFIIPFIVIASIIGIYHFSSHKSFDATTAYSNDNDLASPSHNILLVPLDSRPPCLDLVMETAKLTETKIIVPPSGIMDYYSQPGDTEKIKSWTLENIKECDAAIISVDQLLHGGLLASREAKKTWDDAQKTIDFLISLHNEHPDVPLYVFSVLPRLSPPDSIDGRDERRDLMRYSRLSDIVSQAKPPTKDALTELEQLREKIPPKSLAHYENLFKYNEKLNEELIELTKNGIIYELVIGLDDGEKYGIPNIERRNLETKIAQIDTAHKITVTHGADEIALSILAAIEATRENYNAKIFVSYNDDAAANMTMPYMAISNEESVKEKINMMNCKLSSQKDADFTLFISSFDTPLLSARKKNADYIKNAIDSKKHISLVDLSKNFKAEETLLPRLIKNATPIHSLTAYAGWNTASNSIGTAIAHAVLYEIGLRRCKSENDIVKLCEKQFALLDERFIDDCFYQKDIIDGINHSLRKENYRDINDLDLEHNSIWANAMLQTAIKKRADILSSSEAYRAPMTISLQNDQTINISATSLKADAYFPWPRTFEIRVTTVE